MNIIRNWKILSYWIYFYWIYFRIEYILEYLTEKARYWCYEILQMKTLIHNRIIPYEYLLFSEREYFCNGYGKYHYKTFDGQMIHFPGICKYTLAASSKEASNFFVVEVKNERSGNISYTRLVDIKLKGYTIRLMPGSEMLVSNDTHYK